MASIIATNEHTIPAPSSSHLLQAMGAMAFGLIVLFVVAFAPLNVAHNAAHDTRHTIAVPCH